MFNKKYLTVKKRLIPRGRLELSEFEYVITLYLLYFVILLYIFTFKN